MASTVLIVDDSATMRSALKAYLRAPELSLAEAESGERALALVRLLRPAVALVDLQLPGMSGLELLARLREEGLAQELAVLLVTGEDGAEWAEKSAAAGARGLIRKPVDPVALKARVLELLPGRTP